MDDEAIEFRGYVTLADQVAMTEFLLDQPSARRARLRWRLLFILVFPALGGALGLSIGWLVDHRRPYLPSMMTVLTADGGLAELEIFALAALIATALFALEHLTRRGRLRRRIAKLLRERPGVQPGDPTLAEPMAGSLGPAGLTSVGIASRAELGWASLHALDETNDLFVVRTGSFSGYIIPKRDLTDLQREAIIRIFERHHRERAP